MGIRVVGAAMRGPACVTNAERAGMRTRAIFDTFNKVGNFTGAAAHFKLSSRGKDGDARGVIAAIFELAESFKQYGSYIGALRPDVANDTAHEVGYLSIVCRGPIYRARIAQFQHMPGRGRDKSGPYNITDSVLCWLLPTRFARHLLRVVTYPGGSPLMIRTASTSSTGASSFSPAHALLDLTTFRDGSIPLHL